MGLDMIFPSLLDVVAGTTRYDENRRNLQYIRNLKRSYLRLQPLPVTSQS
jgi:hypothetical protein